MWKWPDESLIGQCEHNITQGFLLVSLLSYQKVVFAKLPIIIKFVFRAFLYLNSSSLHVVLNRYWAHTLIKVIGKIKLVHEVDLVCDHLKNGKIKFRNLESPELSLHPFKPVCRTIFETLWDKLQNLPEMKLTTGVTLLLLSAVDNDIFLFMSQVPTLKSTESTNICYISDRVTYTIKRNIKETFLENNGFARI